MKQWQSRSQRNRDGLNYVADIITSASGCPATTTSADSTTTVADVDKGFYGRINDDRQSKESRQISDADP